MQADGKVLIGGFFDTYNNITRNFLARILNDPASQSLTATSSSRVEWLRGGSAPEVEQVTFDASPDGVVWTPLGSGSRIIGGWQLSDLNLSDSGLIRARGRASNGGSSIIEQVSSYTLQPPPSDSSYESWPLLATLPADKRGPLDRNGPLQIENLLAYAMGLNPLTATAADLPRVGSYDPQAGTVVFRYFRAVETTGTIMRPVVSTDLAAWQDADTGNLVVIETHDAREKVELTLPSPPSGRLFLRLEAHEIP